MTIQIKEKSVVPITVPSDERASQVLLYVEPRNQSMGLEIAKGKGWYGSNGHASTPIDVYEFVVNGESYIFPKNSRINIVSSSDEWNKRELEKQKQHALAKLTQKDREILGL